MRPSVSLSSGRRAALGHDRTPRHSSKFQSTPERQEGYSDMTIDTSVCQKPPIKTVILVLRMRLSSSRYSICSMDRSLFENGAGERDAREEGGRKEGGREKGSKGCGLIRQSLLCGTLASERSSERGDDKDSASSPSSRASPLRLPGIDVGA